MTWGKKALMAIRTTSIKALCDRVSPLYLTFIVCERCLSPKPFMLFLVSHDSMSLSFCPLVQHRTAEGHQRHRNYFSCCLIPDSWSESEGGLYLQCHTSCLIRAVTKTPAREPHALPSRGQSTAHTVGRSKGTTGHTNRAWWS